MFSTFVAVILSVTFVLAFGEVILLEFSHLKLKLFCVKYHFMNLVFADNSTSDLFKEWAGYWSVLRLAGSDIDGYMLSGSLSGWKGESPSDKLLTLFFFSSLSGI